MIKVFHHPKDNYHHQWFAYDDNLNVFTGDKFEQLISSKTFTSSLRAITLGIKNAGYEYSFQYQTFDDLKNNFRNDYPEYLI